ncbi:cytochrome b/b6 domain-containing protein [Alisedimentitalea sp. MJ-SS2]|uniref:cytochrome b/b6 domain-containing protein n=1 Tax=Aliisedimentitalea sp. MJ-SS2 TaxID=3049795 RepID=UPI00290A260A|nr:cytochrome b/b6 domain-containing protein [Alisedimentitalea sp. MJ-SS2]MDU8926281.1 cytochrome b/b6 domain-containing protein [Alisedimentitalea sp. MJ-SS2]
MQRIYIFKRFERFWHWSQAALITTMGVTGFEVHGTYRWLGYETAQEVHTTAAWALITLWVFAIFWHFTTGEWKQYVPTTDKLAAMLRYYLTGIFSHAPHPFRQTQLQKHNPLQRLAYLFVKLLINPLIWISGLFYLYYPQWGAWGLDWIPLASVAFVHLVTAFLMVIFFIVHVYFATTGHTPVAHIKAMITGYEEVEE